MDTMFAITWKYYDNSAFGVVRVFNCKDHAERDMKILQEHTDSRVFEIVEVPYFD